MEYMINDQLTINCFLNCYFIITSYKLPVTVLHTSCRQAGCHWIDVHQKSMQIILQDSLSTNFIKEMG